AERCGAVRLDAAPRIRGVIVGARLAALAPLPEAVELQTPSSMAAAERLARAIERLIDRLPDPREVELTIVLAGAVEGDGHPRIDVRTPVSPDLQLDATAHTWPPRTALPLDHHPDLPSPAYHIAPRP